MSSKYLPLPLWKHMPYHSGSGAGRVALSRTIGFLAMLQSLPQVVLDTTGPAGMLPKCLDRVEFSQHWRNAWQESPGAQESSGVRTA